MRILIIRHGEPNYEIDGLTDKGRVEAELLSQRLVKENITKIYCSPLGRARLTAEPTLKKLGMESEILPWLREFDLNKIKLPYFQDEQIPWDILPEYMNSLENIYSSDGWLEEEMIRNSRLPKAYKNICCELDKILLKHGYRRDGYNYEAVEPNHDTIVFFCHFGTTATLLSHLLNCSPYSLWQHTCMPTSSVTTVYTEERVKGKALFRAFSIGDVSHLYAAGEEVSFSARWCECFTDDTRH